MTRSLLALALLLPALAAAQTPGSCALGTAQADLVTPSLSARLFNTGALFYGNGAAAAYTVPRSRGASPLFAASLWAGGRVGGEVRAAGGSFSVPNSLAAFWPGPLDAGAVLPNPADCSAFDRIWRVAPAEVAAYEAGGAAARDLREWPVGLGAPAVDAQGQPVPIGSREQRLDLPGGERPVLGGGPTAFWVMNDVGNTSGEVGARPLGIEVRVTAFAPEAGALAFRQATFYRYTVVNRNALPITDFHVGLFGDPDLGDATDDYTGTDTTRGLVYTYNGDDEDGTGAGTTYGLHPPAFGFDVLSGLYAAPPIYKYALEVSQPRTAAGVYNRLLGLWNDGTTVREACSGYGQIQGAVTRFAYPGDPVTGAPWSEINPACAGSSNQPGDSQFAVSGLPVTLAPGAATTFDVGMLFGQGATNIASITTLRAASDLVQTAYDAGTLFAGGPVEGTAAAPTLLAPAEDALVYEAPVTFSWAPVAGASGYLLELSTTADFALVDAEPTPVATVTLPASRFPANREAPLFWRVRTTRDGLDGPPSAARGVRVYRYAPAPLTLASGAFAFVETVAPGGGPACTPGDPDEGCAEVGGDLVFESLNSTGAYRLVSLQSAAASPGAFAPRSFEIRFTPRGSIAYADASPGSSLFRVPFEVWDIGPAAPGAANDPADDRQLVVRLSGSNGTGGRCAFGFTYPLSGDGPLGTRLLAAYYPVGDDYAAYDALAAATVAAAPDGCATDASIADARARVDLARGRPLYGFSFQQAGAVSVADLAGTTVRFYTTQRAVAAEGAPAAASVLRLGAAFPNPASAALTVPVSLPAPGRLRLVDVLGRSVVDVRLEAGEQRVRLDTGRIAAGVYAVVLEVGAERAVRTVTVVR